MTAWPTLIRAVRRPLDRWRQVAGAATGSLCQVCGDWQSAPICATCRQVHGAVAARCRCCGSRWVGLDPVCRDCARRPPAFGRTVVALDYAYPWDGLIARFKYGDACELAGPLAALLTEAASAALADGSVTRPDCLVPVPLSAARWRERGYNQAWELARRVARALDLPADPDAVERIVATPSQAGLSRQERLHNLRGAFLVSPAARARLAGAHVALVDDVMTTGATADELALTLCRAGAASVQCWMLARTRADHGPDRELRDDAGHHVPHRPGSP
jgi:ComF family protein